MLPPQNIEVEQSLLGALMIDSEAIYKISDAITPEDFYKRAHQLIYAAALTLNERREAIDYLTVTSLLKERGQIEDVGGSSYVASLVETVISPSHIVDYASAIKRKKISRDLIATANDIAEMGMSENEDIDVVLDEAERRIYSISKHSMKSGFVAVKSTLEDAYDRIERIHKGDGSLRGVPTGFVDLDAKLAGLQKSDLVILAARPSLGKTTLALDIVRHVGVHEKKPVGVFSIEMSKEQIIDRLIAAEARVDLWKLRTGRLSSEGEHNDFERIQQGLGILSESPIFVDDGASPSVMDIRASARRLQAEHGLSLIVVDYLQLIKARNANESMVQQMTEVSRALKALAKELDVPVLAISQLSRAVEQRPDKIPRLSDLRESGSIEQDADVVIFISREDSSSHNIEKSTTADIIIAKHRNGPTGKLQLFFDQQRVAFTNMTKEDYDFVGF